MLEEVSLVADEGPVDVADEAEEIEEAEDSTLGQKVLLHACISDSDHH